jgi:hypothetical protein
VAHRGRAHRSAGHRGEDMTFAVVPPGERFLVLEVSVVLEYSDRGVAERDRPFAGDALGRLPVHPARNADRLLGNGKSLVFQVKVAPAQPGQLPSAQCPGSASCGQRLPLRRPVAGLTQPQRLNRFLSSWKGVPIKVFMPDTFGGGSRRASHWKGRHDLVIMSEMPADSPVQRIGEAMSARRRRLRRTCATSADPARCKDVPAGEIRCFPQLRG